jgi:hypothetical protein
MPKSFYWPILLFSLTITAAIAPLCTYGQLKTIQLDTVNIIAPKSQPLQTLTFQKQRWINDTTTMLYSATYTHHYAYYKYTFIEAITAQDIAFRHSIRKKNKDTLLVQIYIAPFFTDSIPLDSVHLVVNQKVFIKPGTKSTILSFNDLKLPAGEILFKLSTKNKRAFYTAAATQGHFCSGNGRGKIHVWKWKSMGMPWFRFRYYTLP